MPAGPHPHISVLLEACQRICRRHALWAEVQRCQKAFITWELSIHHIHGAWLYQMADGSILGQLHNRPCTEQDNHQETSAVQPGGQHGDFIVRQYHCASNFKLTADFGIRLTSGVSLTHLSASKGVAYLHFHIQQYDPSGKEWQAAGLQSSIFPHLHRQEQATWTRAKGCATTGI